MAVLERGGNAFDAAVAAGLDAAGRRAAPERAGRRPSRGLLAGGARRAARALRAGRRARRGDDRARPRRWATSSCPARACSRPASPARSAAGCCCSSEFGTWRLEDVLAFAIGYAEHGYPVVAGITMTIERVRAAAPRVAGARRSCTCRRRGPGRRSATRSSRRRGRRLLDEARGGSREDEIERARRVFYEGFVAEEIDRFSRENGGLLDAATTCASGARRSSRR